MTQADVALLVTYYLVLSILAIYGTHRLHLVKLLRRNEGNVDAAAPEKWPSVVVQLPLFNESAVAERLIDACAQLEYPGRLTIQVLDDSTDATPEIVARAAEHWRARGVDVRHVRRASRAGYKAGALANGLASSDAELVAIFDADFVPPRDLLLRMVPHFDTPSIGMVQARWTHLNRPDNALTRAQAIYLDGHFSVESAARYFSGRFFNFNGTAGIWRRRAIEDAGGWSAETLTEDLDLSYRAQLAGWKFKFLPAVAVPGELPRTLSAFRTQQHRWAKGSAQTSLRLLPEIIRAPLPMRVKLEAMYHLTSNASYPLTLLLALLLVPAMAIRFDRGAEWLLLLDAPLFAASTLSILSFYLEGQRRVGERPRLRDFANVLPFGVGLSVSNTAAVLEGLAQRGGHFVRTMKFGTSTRRFDGRPPLVVGDLILAVFYLFAFIVLARSGHYEALPFVGLFLAGFAYMAAQSIVEVVAARTEASGAAPGGHATGDFLSFPSG